MGLTKGYKYKKLSAAQHTQKINASVKSLEARSKKYCNPDDTTRQRHETKTVIKDGYKHLKKLKELTNCDICAARASCPEYESIMEDGTSEAHTRCPLWTTYRQSIIDVTQEPLMYLAKKAGDLDIAIVQQKMIDAKEGKPLSKIMLDATKIALEAVKISQKAEIVADKRGRRITGENPDDVIIDI